MEPGLEGELLLGPAALASDVSHVAATLRGTFLKKHRVEIPNLALDQEKLEKSACPLHRIMAIEDKGARGHVSGRGKVAADEPDQEICGGCGDGRTGGGRVPEGSG